MSYSPPPPPPLPGKSNTVLWIYLVGGAVLLVMLVIGGTAAVAFKRVKEKAAAKAALNQLEKEVNAARAEVGESYRKGEPAAVHDKAGRIKEAMEKSAAKMSGNDAAIARAGANFMSRTQKVMKKYETAAERMTAAEVLSFNVADRATIAEHRRLTVEFMAASAELTDLLRHGEEVFRAELVAEKVSAKGIENTIGGFRESYPQRDAQLRAREHERVVGESGLAVFDLLEKSWGKWKRNEAGNQLVFEDDETLDSYNKLVVKIQDATEKQAKELEFATGFRIPVK